MAAMAFLFHKDMVLSLFRLEPTPSDIMSHHKTGRLIFASLIQFLRENWLSQKRIRFLRRSGRKRPVGPTRARRLHADCFRVEFSLGLPSRPREFHPEPLTGGVEDWRADAIEGPIRP